MQSDKSANMHPAFQEKFMVKRAKQWAKDLANKKTAIKEGQEKVLGDAASVKVSVSWKGKVDLDTGCVVYAGSTVRSMCWHRTPESKFTVVDGKQKAVEDKKIVHMGDVQEGGDADDDGDGASEEMRIKLSSLDAEVTTIAIYLCCFNKGTTFNDADDAAITIAAETFDVPAETFDAQNTVTKSENIVKFSIADMDNSKSAVLLGAFNRVKGDKWAFEALSVMSDGTEPVSEPLATTLLTYAEERTAKRANRTRRKKNPNVVHPKADSLGSNSASSALTE